MAFSISEESSACDDMISDLDIDIKPRWAKVCHAVTQTLHILNTDMSKLGELPRVKCWFVHVVAFCQSRMYAVILFWEGSQKCLSEFLM